MNINVHTTIIVEDSFFCTLTSHVWQCKVSNSFALNYHGIYSHPEDYDDRSGTWGDNEPDLTVRLFAFVSIVSIGESTCPSLHCKSLRIFLFTFPTLKQKVVVTINSHNVMTICWEITFPSMQRALKLTRFFFKFTIPLLYIDMLSLLRTTIFLLLYQCCREQTNQNSVFQDNFQVIMSPSIFAGYLGRY